MAQYIRERGSYNKNTGSLTASSMPGTSALSEC